MSSHERLTKLYARVEKMQGFWEKIESASFAVMAGSAGLFLTSGYDRTYGFAFIAGLAISTFLDEH